MHVTTDTTTTFACPVLVGKTPTDTVLVVDDESVNVTVLSKLLKDRGFAVVTAASGEEALELLDCHNIDLVLLDIQMPPGIDGFEVLRRIRQTTDEAALPVIIVTANDTTEQVVRAFNAGANDYLAKPIDAAVTIARINTQMKLKRAQSALRESEERYSLAAQGANDGLWDWNLTTDKVYYSPRWNEMLGLCDDELSCDPEAWLSRVHVEDRSRVEAKLQRHLDAESPHFETELRIRHKSGDYRWMLCRGQAVRDEHGKPLRIAGSLTDITTGKVADAITGLPNRVLFLDRVQRCVDQNRREGGRLFAVMYLDLDNFKLVNDGLGHAAGDLLLTTVARRLEQTVRSAESVVARLGGDEFAILLENLRSEDDSIRVAKRILRSFERPFQLGPREVFVTVSVGLSLSSSNFDTTEDLVRKADTAMYQAKEQGRSCFRIFDPAMQERVAQRLKFESDLRRAIERNELLLNFQPIVAIQTGEILGFETLLRWEHPQLGFVAPERFIPIAEATGLIVPIGRWVLENACEQLMQWKSRSSSFDELYITANISQRQMRCSELLKDTQSIVADTGIGRGSLQLEVTESTVMEDPDEGSRLLANLREQGIKIAVDDFGTGYSSLACLHRLPIDALKVDRSFVSQMTNNRENLAIVRTIIRLAESLGLDVVAEGIETTDQRDLLAALHCESGQGFLYSKPLSADDAFELARDGKRIEVPTIKTVRESPGRDKFSGPGNR